jgi:CRISPR-associated endonuclease/helicase Cas3
LSLSDASSWYLKFWGKAQPFEASGPRWHPLAYHSLDVAAVGIALLQADARLQRRLTHVSMLDEAAVRRWLFLALALHDLGKFAPAFQAKVPELFERQFGADGWQGPNTGHDMDGLLLWQTQLVRRDLVLEAFSAIGEERPHHRRNAITEWIASATCHHGQPRDASSGILSDRFRAEHLAGIDAFIGDVLHLAESTGKPAETPPPEQRTASWFVAGTAVLADWIGSNQIWFPYREADVDLRAYWQDWAMPKARNAVLKAGVVAAQPSVQH